MAIESQTRKKSFQGYRVTVTKTVTESLLITDGRLGRLEQEYLKERLFTPLDIPTEIIFIINVRTYMKI